MNKIKQCLFFKFIILLASVLHASSVSREYLGRPTKKLTFLVESYINNRICLQQSLFYEKKIVDLVVHYHGLFVKQIPSSIQETLNTILIKNAAKFLNTAISSYYVYLCFQHKGALLASNPGSCFTMEINNNIMCPRILIKKMSSYLDFSATSFQFLAEFNIKKQCLDYFLSDAPISFEICKEIRIYDAKATFPEQMKLLNKQNATSFFQGKMGKELLVFVAIHCSDKVFASIPVTSLTKLEEYPS